MREEEKGEKRACPLRTARKCEIKLPYCFYQAPKEKKDGRNMSPFI